MHRRLLDIGIVTDEISRDLAEAFSLGTSWEITRFELREGGERRFPHFTREEIHLVEGIVREGGEITAVSPGILKGAADDEARIKQELERVLPRSLELAGRFGCRTVIVFGFERYDGEPQSNRARVLRAFERAAEQAAAAGMQVLVENEPNFWVDRPADEAALLSELDHPQLGANWDPANAVWGGATIDRAGFEAISPFLRNLHVKDYDPEDSETLWKPIGQGRVPWQEILRWIAEETDLPHVTLETHCEPLKENTRRSLDALRDMLRHLETTGPQSTSSR